MLTDSLRHGTPLGVAEYTKACSAARRSQRKSNDLRQSENFKRLCNQAKQADSRRMNKAKETGAWLTAMPNTLNGTELSADEFRDNLRIRFGLTPASLPHRCEGCGERFSVEHAMSCKKGGLVMLRHNDVVAEWHHLCAKALGSTAITDEPLIHTSRDVRQAGANGNGNGNVTTPQPELRGDIAAHGFWRRGTTTIFDVRITDTEVASNRGQDPKKVLKRHEREKKLKYNALCQERRRHFTPLVFSVDGLQGTEAAAACKRLSSLLADKWKRSYSEVCGYVRSRLSVALARSTSRCLRADRDPLIVRPNADWVEGTGLSLYE